jgi:hypothetical protein
VGGGKKCFLGLRQTALLSLLSAEGKNFPLVAILNCCSKIMEEIVQQQFETHFKGMKLIPEEQHGFRPSRSMSSAAHVAVHDIRRLRVDGKCVVSL